MACLLWPRAFLLKESACNKAESSTQGRDLEAKTEYKRANALLHGQGENKRHRAWPPPTNLTVFTLAAEETIAVSARLKSKITTTLRTRETVAEQQIYSVANSGNRKEMVEAR